MRPMICQGWEKYRVFTTPECGIDLDSSCGCRWNLLPKGLVLWCACYVASRGSSTDKVRKEHCGTVLYGTYLVRGHSRYHSELSKVKVYVHS